MKQVYPLCDDNVSIIANGNSVPTFLFTWKYGPKEISTIAIIADSTSVSAFLCTQKLGPEEVSVIAASTHLFDETEVLLQGCTWWLSRV